MEITCPNCGQTCEVDEEPAIGRHLLCPFCDMKFNYTPQNTTENDSNSIANTAEPKMEASPAKIQATCPHCGAVYEVDAAYIGKTATCGTCDNPFVIKAAHGHAAAVSGKESPKMLLAKAKSAVNTAKDTLIPVLKTAANKTKTKAIPALKSIISGIAVFLAISLAVPFLLSFSDDSNAVNPAINAAVSKNSRTNTTSENHAEKIKEALQALGKYIETPTDRRLQALSQSLESCPQDFQEAVKAFLNSANKTYEDMISKQEQDDAMAGTIFLGLLAGAVSDNPGDAMSAGFQIGNAIQGGMQQKAQKRLEQEIEHRLADLIDIARKYGVDSND